MWLTRYLNSLLIIRYSNSNIFLKRILPFLLFPATGRVAVCASLARFAPFRAERSKRGSGVRFFLHINNSCHPCVYCGFFVVGRVLRFLHPLVGSTRHLDRMPNIRNSNSNIFLKRIPLFLPFPATGRGWGLGSFCTLTIRVIHEIRVHILAFRPPKPTPHKTGSMIHLHKNIIHPPILNHFSLPHPLPRVIILPS